MNYRHRANLILGAVFLLFAVVAVLRHFQRDVFAIKLLFSILEAALIGGIADWFAVTALFRRPLGISFHTALIPRNRKKLIEALSKTVEQDLLSVDSIEARIQNVCVIRPMLDWVESRNGVERIARLIAGLLEDYLQGLDPEETARKLDRLLRTKLSGIDLSAQVEKVGRWALAEGDNQTLDFALDRLIVLARSPAARRKIYTLIKEQEKQQTKGSFFKSFLADILEATNSLNLDDAAAAVHGELVKRLTAMKETEHPLRLKIEAMLLEQLGNSAEWQGSLEAWKQTILRDLPLAEALDSLVRAVVGRVAGSDTLTAWVTSEVHRYWEQLKQDQNLQDWLEGYIKVGACRILRAEHYLIGNVVRETLGFFSDEDLNNFIEAKAGNDLQWIRVNGSLIGGAVGLALFLFLNFVYDPIVLPAVRELLR